MLKLSKLTSDFVIYGVAPFIPKFAGFLILPLITPHLSSSDFGIYGIIIAYSTFLELFFNLGLQVNLSNSFFKSPKQYKWLWRQLYGFWIQWAFVFALIKAFLLWFVIPEEVESNKQLIIVLSILPVVIFGPTGRMAEYYYQFKRKPIQIAIRGIAFGLINIILLYYFVKYLNLKYMSWFWATCISGLLLNASWWIPFNFFEGMTPIFNYKIKTIYNSLRISLPIIPHQNGLFLLNQSDRVVMDIIGISTTNIGLYNIANNAVIPFTTADQAYSKALNPYIQQLLKSKNFKYLRLLYFNSQIIFFLAVLIYACIAKEFVHFLFRVDNMGNVYQISVILAMGVISRPMYMASNSILFFYEKTKNVGIYSFIAGVLNVGLNFMLIPIFGFEIAAATTVISFLFLGYSRFFTKDFKENNSEKYYPVGWLIVSVAIVISGYFISDFDFNIRIIILSVLLILSFIYFLRTYILIKK